MAENVVLEYEANVVSRVLAFMSYLGILCLFPLILSRRDDYVNFHARQGVILWALEMIALCCVYIPGIGLMILEVLGIICLAFSIAGLASVILGRAWKLPLVGALAEKL